MSFLSLLNAYVCSLNFQSWILSSKTPCQIWTKIGYNVLSLKTVSDTSAIYPKMDTRRERKVLAFATMGTYSGADPGFSPRSPSLVRHKNMGVLFVKNSWFYILKSYFFSIFFWGGGLMLGLPPPPWIRTWYCYIYSWSYLVNRNRVISLCSFLMHDCCQWEHNLTS